MQPTQKFEEDVAFVREAVEKRDRMQYDSIAIALLWAIIVATGYSLNDFRPHASPIFWCIAVPIGFLISFWVAKRASRAKSIAKRGDRTKSRLHWGSFFVVIPAILFIAVRHDLDTSMVMNQFITLAVGIIFYFAGLHLDRRFLLPGIVHIVGAPAIDYLAPYPWTIVGLAIAASLIISMIWMNPREKATA